MPEPTHIALCQINPTVGDLAGNNALILKHYRTLAPTHDLVVFPELALLGYPPEDLVLMPGFQQAAQDALATLVEATAGQGAALLVGGLQVKEDTLYNAAFLLEGGAVRHIARKHFLPNSGVFDEMRVFAPGPLPAVVAWRGCRLAFLVCEDMWHPEIFPGLAAQGCEAVLVINGSPFEAGKQAIRKQLATDAATRHGLAIFYLNMVGGQDELVFDGQSFAMNAKGEVVHRLAAFAEDTASYTFADDRIEAHSPSHPTPGWDESVYAAVTLGLRDYVEKNGAPGVLLGLSGGVDSALAACIAVDALGPGRVRSVMLASPYTAAISHEDAAAVAKNLGIRHETLAIAPGMQAVDAMLAGLPEGVSPLAQENLQSRLRGLTLMAISNSTGYLLISTGNKSEMATGYATLYGDMCGAFNPLKDIYKTEIYALCRWRNAQRWKRGLGPAGAVLPERVLTRAPSAELRDNQTDQDSLPPYDRLDAMLRLLIEGRQASQDLLTAGFSFDEVARTTHLLRLSEYKRRQAPPGPKISPLSFGRDRRFPVTNRFKF
jgi:NAD+ synthase